MFFNIRRQLKNFSQKPELKIGLQGEDIKNNWDSVIKKINKNAQGKSKALYLKKDGTLVVKVTSHTWLQEMVFYQEEIKKEINKKDVNIKKVRFITGS
jgi:hypothetical protein